MKNLVIAAFILFQAFVLESCFNKHKVLFYYDTPPAEFIRKDYSQYQRLPKVYQLILDNDYYALTQMPKNSLSVKCNINHITYTPLLFACKHNRSQISNFLIDMGADIDYRNNLGDGALHFLAVTQSDDSLLIKRLITENYFNKPDRNGHTPLYYAALENNFIIFNSILQHSPPYMNWYGTEEMMNCFTVSQELPFMKATAPYVDWNKPNMFNRKPIYDFILLTNLYNDTHRRYTDLSHQYDKDSFDIRVAQVYMENGMDINVKFEKNRSILFEILKNNVLIMYLCDKVNNLNDPDDEGNTFLNFYINNTVYGDTLLYNYKKYPILLTEKECKDNINTIEYLISKGAVVKQPYKNGYVYLVITALSSGNTLLLEIFSTKFKTFNDLEKKEIKGELYKNLSPDEYQKILQILSG